MNKRVATRLAIIATSVLVLAITVTTTILIKDNVPPGSGTIFDKGSHQQYYGQFGAPTVFFLGIKSDSNPNLSWTWYVKEQVYERFEVGDYINLLGGKGG